MRNTAARYRVLWGKWVTSLDPLRIVNASVPLVRLVPVLSKVNRTKQSAPRVCVCCVRLEGQGGGMEETGGPEAV
jgi:hypothetical protein